MEWAIFVIESAKMLINLMKYDEFCLFIYFVTYISLNNVTDVSGNALNVSYKTKTKPTGGTSELQFP